MVLLITSIWLADNRCSDAAVQFIFGDSLSDAGNNNFLTKSLARAALPWYGIDFGSGLPNGRFTNGRTIADIVGDRMGLPRPPAFLDPSLDGDTILEKGVNYASGGGGILNETSSLFVGSNDYINNFLLPVYSDSWTYNGETFTNYVISTLEGQLKLLHSMGARKLTFFGLGPMGCIPLQRIMTSSGECQESTNKLALMFNKNSMNLLETLSRTLPNATFQFGDAYDIFQDLINQPEIYGILFAGFENSNAPCCRIAKIRPTLTCTPLSTLCKDRSKYVFWDEYHPTDKANELIANAVVSKLGLAKPANTTNE
ncbi:GDSL esterase/lipase [Apostasia shenzhenica]|uniref:GDSL esterase/lipase n=1 Tax=Apostasia shenzhenica TaxID=1088818 RepID=A0A2H9ZUX1_9ASPA|nr:GDSL esterase/lipase [Apostasia shenzhenica]